MPTKLAASLSALGSGVNSFADVAAAVGTRSMLVILDNCEHLVADAAEGVRTILGLCPQVTVLATSRERLHLAGETVYRLPSLPEESAAELFMQRAREVNPSLALASERTPSVLDVWRRLDGFPSRSSSSPHALVCLALVRWPGA